MAFSRHHSVKAWLVSSVPLSQRIALGLPWISMSCSRKRITRLAGMLTGAKAMALTALDLIEDPAFLARVREEFDQRSAAS